MELDNRIASLQTAQKTTAELSLQFTRLVTLTVQKISVSVIEQVSYGALDTCDFENYFQFLQVASGLTEEHGADQIALDLVGLIGEASRAATKEKNNEVAKQAALLDAINTLTLAGIK
jgi:hypothetical protein